MNKCCASSNCTITDFSADWVTCNGLCGKSFHPACTGLSKRALTYLKEILTNYVFVCGECKDISLSHVMLAIKCNNDSVSTSFSDCASLMKKILDHLNKLNGLSKSIDDFATVVENNNELSKSKFKNLEKLSSAISSSTVNIPVLDDKLNNLSNVVCDLFKNSHSIRKLTDELSSLRTELMEHMRSSNKGLAELRSRSTPPPSRSSDTDLPLIIDLSTKINSVATELSCVRRALDDLVDDSRTASTSMLHQPHQHLPSTNNTSLLDELQPLVSNQATPSSRPVASSVFVQTSPPVSSQPTPAVSLLSKFGTTWTESEWEQRLKRLSSKHSSSPSDHTPFLLKGAPHNANDSWVHSFFFRNFAFTPVSCQKLLSPDSRKSSNFKIFIPNKFAWLISNPSSRIFTLGNIEISKWTKKYVKFSPNPSAPNPNYNINKPNPTNTPRRINKRPSPMPKPSTLPSRKNTNMPKSSISPSRKNTNTSNNYTSIPYPNISHHSSASPTYSPKANNLNSNWQFKMGVFPNFNLSTPVKYPNFSYSHTLNPSVPLIPKPSNTTSSTDHPAPTVLIPHSPTPPAHLPNQETPISSACPPNHKPSSSDHPPATLSTNVCPTPPAHPPNHEPSTSSSSSTNPPNSLTKSPSPNNPSYIDPLLPPVVKLTMRSADSNDGRYLLSRLRDHRIYDNVRLFLAYLHDKPNSVCIDGKTRTNVMISIHQEGLPTDPTVLHQLFTKYHESFNIPSHKVSEDLSAYASYISSRRISHLQKSRNDSLNYYRS